MRALGKYENSARIHLAVPEWHTNQLPAVRWTNCKRNGGGNVKLDVADGWFVVTRRHSRSGKSKSDREMTRTSGAYDRFKNTSLLFQYRKPGRESATLRKRQLRQLGQYMQVDCRKTQARKCSYGGNEV